MLLESPRLNKFKIEYGRISKYYHFVTQMHKNVFLDYTSAINVLIIVVYVSYWLEISKMWNIHLNNTLLNLFHRFNGRKWSVTRWNVEIVNHVSSLLKWFGDLTKFWNDLKINNFVSFMNIQTLWICQSTLKSIFLGLFSILTTLNLPPAPTPCLRLKVIERGITFLNYYSNMQTRISHIPKDCRDNFMKLSE